jgi:O-antigen ligase
VRNPVSVVSVAEPSPNAVARPDMKPWLWAVFLGLLAFSTANTKVGGTAWLLMSGLGVWAMFSHRGWRPETAEDEVIWRAARLWLLFCAIAFTFKAIGVTYWGDPWRTRHFDLRVLLTAVSLFFFVSHLSLGDGRRKQLIGALLVAACGGFLMSYLHVTYEVETPSNRINWAGGLVMLSWALMPVMAMSQIARRWRWMAFAGVLLLWGAVLMSGARSAYLSLPWLLVCAVVLMACTFRRRHWARWLGGGAAAVLLAGSMLYAVVPKVLEVPLNRVEIAIHDAQKALLTDEDDGRDVDTPVGSRIYMWERSLEVFKESPWIGYGRAQRIAFIKAWGKEAKAHIVSDQFHLHSEYINGMVDHGLVGLASTLAYMLGLVVVALTLRREFPLMALSIGGIAFTHITMSLTNANSQTNNYSVIFGLALTVVFQLRARRQGARPPSPT